MEDKNLSWLINYKLDELPHLSPEAKRKALNGGGDNKTNGGGVAGGEVQGYEKTHFEDDTNVAENVTIEHAMTRTPKKPPFTYTELIEYALEEQGELTVSGIYQWISDRFKYYKSNDDRWKNSVRHNLSINPHFRKGSKATQGAGHLWTISSRDSEVNLLAWEHKKQRLELFFKMEESANRAAVHIETTMATQQLQQQLQSESQQMMHTNHDLLNSQLEHDHRHHQQQQQQHHLLQPTYENLVRYSVASPTTVMTTTSIAAANDINGTYATYRANNSQCPNANRPMQQQLQHQQHQQPQLYHHHHHVQPLDELQHDLLQKSAGEILHGVNRNVEVQVMQTSDNCIQSYAILDSDYLNPISKDEIVQECGLRATGAKRFEPGHEYYVTTIDPVELGISLPAGVENDGILFEDEFNFQYFGSNIIAWWCNDS